MKTYVDSDWLDTGLNRQHVRIALVACAVSLVIHAVLLLGLENSQFVMLHGEMADPEEEHIITTYVGNVTPDEPGAVERPDGLEKGASGVDVALLAELEAVGVPPSRAALEPRAVGTEHMAADRTGLVEPDMAPMPRAWEPRQEILAIKSRIATDKLKPFKRRVVPAIERVAKASDVVLPLDRETMVRVVSAGANVGMIGSPPAAAISTGTADTGTGTGAGTLEMGETASTDPNNMFLEKPDEITPTRPLEKRLTASISTYVSSRERDYGYFRIEIERIGEEKLPVIPKDVVFVQDCSASITAQRLHFCREGLVESLALVGPQDRFNIVAFRDSSTRCFPQWAPGDAESLQQARSFIKAMRSEGETDVFASVQELLKLERRAGRPLVAIVVTDGRPTTGVIQSSDIIAGFTKINEGNLSVFTLGTIHTANRYLLDMLGYANRGDSVVVTTGRWDIRTEIPGLAREISRPVMGDVQFRFPYDAPLEVYPVLTENLYLDRPLVLYGRYPISTKNVVFQAIGQAGDTPCDMIFDLSLAKASRVRDDSIREKWAAHKIYDLIVQHARTPNPQILDTIKATSRKYRVRIPHRGSF